MGISNTKDDSSLMKAKRAFAKQYVRNDTYGDQHYTLCLFLQQETFSSLLRTGCFQERIRAWFTYEANFLFHNRAKLNKYKLN